jgi:hypothetical protein
MHDLSGLLQATMPMLPAPASCRVYRCLVLNLWKGYVLRFNASGGSAFAWGLHNPICLMPYLRAVIYVAMGSW